MSLVLNVSVQSDDSNVGIIISSVAVVGLMNFDLQRLETLQRFLNRLVVSPIFSRHNLKQTFRNSLNPCVCLGDETVCCERKQISPTHSKSKQFIPADRTMRSVDDKKLFESFKFHCIYTRNNAATANQDFVFVDCNIPWKV
jgi:hypothetical protein